ncbi:hypothetical protein CSV75_02920 [Sporosarcina sp. P18a]|uniref:membrane lipoprotein lipid attachment site-containing protein n=1 Tax=Sporosarcina sp. P18a TaxID=2048259 RepID=UPI000C16380C|nr:membrane lipoprotein lipid attachment site-containing protein [Sporosarcina sp. P18a]PIC80756.1 hypothetical protein CSV75_02920 [Sporosarcina sp. P18a]
MKKIASLIFAALLLTACGSAEPDYTTEQFETALKNGENTEGKNVSITVDELVPDSAFGYNVQTGEHLNFVSSSNPNVKKGDEIIVKVGEVESVLGSFIIQYKKQ